MKLFAKVLQSLLALAFVGITATLWFLMITQGDDAWFGWRRSISLMGLYLDMYAFLLVNVTVLPVVVLSVWRALQLWGVLPEHVGVRWANKVLLSTAVACLLVVTVRWQLWEEVLGGSAKSNPTPPSDEKLEYPPLPITPDPPFAWELKAVDGSVVNLADLKGKVVFVNIWATWCGYCKYEFPNMQRLVDGFKDNPNVVFLFVTEEDKETVDKWVTSDEGEAYSLPFYTTEKIHKRFDPSGYPTTFIVAPNGETVFEHSGFVAWDGVKTQEFLKALAAG
jgi:thiol-disulfide isomerase/thioredoxin